MAGQQVDRLLQDVGGGCIQTRLAVPPSEARTRRTG